MEYFLLSVSFLYAIRSLVKANQTAIMIESENQIVAELSESLPQQGALSEEGELALITSELPYYHRISPHSIYDVD